MSIIELIDSQLLLLINSCHSSWADGFMMMFTGRFIWIPMYVTLAFILARSFKPRRALLAFIGIALAIALADQICATLIRPLVSRLRPSHPDNPLSVFVTLVNGYRAGSHGFPSCHAANSFALLSYISLVVPRRRLAIFLLIWAVVNCYSRLYLGVHYPGDIIVGATIGTICGTAVALAFRRYIGMPLPAVGSGLRLRQRSESGWSLPFVNRQIYELNFQSLTLSDAAPIVGLATVIVIAAVAL